MDTCPNCNHATARCVRRVNVTRSRHPAELSHCQHCDFLFLANPHWLNEAYEIGFYGDTGYVQRNLTLVRFLRLLLIARRLYGRSASPFQGCDLGTGLGMLPRLMRDHGFDFFGSDQFADMQLIQPFVNPSFDAPFKTAFEVVEHLPSLPHFFDSQLGAFDIFVFSTVLRPDGSVPDEGWWYYLFAIGQHISFHSRRSLSYAMEAQGIPPRSLLSHDTGLHAMALTPSWQGAFRTASGLSRRGLAPLVLGLVDHFFARDSLVWRDHLHAMASLAPAD